jgi:hypothetical protein
VGEAHGEAEWEGKALRETETLRVPEGEPEEEALGEGEAPAWLGEALLLLGPLAVPGGEGETLAVGESAREGVTVPEGEGEAAAREGEAGRLAEVVRVVQALGDEEGERDALEVTLGVCEGGADALKEDVAGALALALALPPPAPPPLPALDVAARLALGEAEGVVLALAQGD